MPYHAVVVFTLGYDFLFKSLLAHCVGPLILIAFNIASKKGTLCVVKSLKFLSFCTINVKTKKIKKHKLMNKFPSDPLSS